MRPSQWIKKAVSMTKALSAMRYAMKIVHSQSVQGTLLLGNHLPLEFIVL